MPEKGQNSGRMLFTDFDASDKGRPVAIFDDPAVTAAATLEAPEIPTLDEIAAQLGFAFEDDGDGNSNGAPPPIAPAQPAKTPEKPVAAVVPAAAVVTAAPVAPDAPDDDLDLALADIGATLQKPEPETAPAPPTWDDLARSYDQAKPVENIVSVVTAPAPAPARGAAPGAADTVMLDDQFAAPPPPDPDADVDVLSMLDVLLEHEAPRRHTTTRVVAPPRATPYGGIERVEDWFTPPENQPEELKRIEDWFSPPENQPPPVAAVEGWYEPPADEVDPDTETDELVDDGGDGDEDDPGETKVDISWLDFNNELPVMAPAAAPRPDTRTSDTVRLPRALSGAPGVMEHRGGTANPADTMVLFSEMDFDNIWEKKVAAKQQARTQTPPTPPSDKDTRAVDLFENFDVDRAWEEKKNNRPSRRAAAVADAIAVKEGRLPGSAAETMILDPSQLAALPTAGAADTVILREDLVAPRIGLAAEDAADPSRPEVDSVLAELDGMPLPPPPPKSRKSVRRKASAAAPGTAAPAADDEDILAAVPAPDKPPAAATDEATAPAGGEYNAAVSEPEPVPPDTGDTAPAPDSADNAAGDDNEFDVDSLVEEAAGMDFAGAIIGDGSGRSAADDSDNDGEFVARTPPAGGAASKKKPGLTTDDLLDDLDSEDFAGGADDIAAPVIDDSAITAIDAAGDGDGAEASSNPAAAVAVNPMDVFADMDNMDFSDDVDDDMRAMLEDEEGELADEEGAEGEAAAASGAAAGEAEEEEIPTTRFGRLRFRAGKIARRALPMKVVDKAMTMVAWRENWWFYCDLVAAVVASASLAVIISYLFWYRGA